MCSRHFEHGRPTTENPYPTLFSYNNYKELPSGKSEAAINKRACIIHDKQDAEMNARVRQTFDPVMYVL